MDIIPQTEAWALVDATPAPGDRVVKPSGILGRGLVRPFRRDDRRDFSSAEGPALVRACVGQILGMNGASPKTMGELEWDPERGSLLYLLRHQKNDVVLTNLGRTYVIDCLRRFEPRVVVKSVTVKRSIVDNVEIGVDIFLLYDFIKSNVSTNEVLFQDIEQNLFIPFQAGG